MRRNFLIAMCLGVASTGCVGLAIGTSSSKSSRSRAFPAIECSNRQVVESEFVAGRDLLAAFVGSTFVDDSHQFTSPFGVHKLGDEKHNALN